MVEMKSFAGRRRRSVYGVHDRFRGRREREEADLQSLIPCQVSRIPNLLSIMWTASILSKLLGIWESILFTEEIRLQLHRSLAVIQQEMPELSNRPGPGCDCRICCSTTGCTCRTHSCNSRGHWRSVGSRHSYTSRGGTAATSQRDEDTAERSGRYGCCRSSWNGTIFKNIGKTSNQIMRHLTWSISEVRNWCQHRPVYRSCYGKCRVVRFAPHLEVHSLVSPPIAPHTGVSKPWTTLSSFVS